MDYSSEKEATKKKTSLANSQWVSLISLILNLPTKRLCHFAYSLHATENTLQTKKILLRFVCAYTSDKYSSRLMSLTTSVKALKL